MALYACIGLLHFLHTELTWSEIPCKLSQHWVKLHIDWVNAEWDSTSAESMRSETLHQLSQCGVRLYISWVNAEWDSTSAESMRSETLHQLSQCRVRLYISWVNAEWDSTSAESMRSETLHQLSQCGMRQYWRKLHHSPLTQLMSSLTLRWRSWLEVSLGVESVDGKWESTSTEPPPNEKKFEYVSEFKNTIKKLILWPI